MLNVTDLEAKVLVAMCEEGLECMGGETAEDLKDDNMSWMKPSEMADATGIPMNQLRGVISSLEKKGLACDSGESMVDGVSRRSKNNNDWYLSDEGIDEAFKRL